MSQILLPCACGANIPVNRSQAGMSLQCPECGKTVEVPTIRKLAEFASPAKPKKAVKKGQAAKWLAPIAAASLIVGLIGSAFGAFLFYERYDYVSFVTKNGADINLKEEDFMASVRKTALQATPADTWDYWNVMLEEGLKDPNPPDLIRVKRYLASRLPTMFGSFLTGIIGIAIFALASFLIQRSRRPSLDPSGG